MSRQNKARRKKVIAVQMASLHKKGIKNNRTKKLHNKRQQTRRVVVAQPLTQTEVAVMQLANA